MNMSMNRQSCMSQQAYMNQQMAANRMNTRMNQQTSASAFTGSQKSCDDVSELPTGSRMQLMNYLNEVSFAAYDTRLYLDTHPEDTDAQTYFRQCCKKRHAAIREYERLYGPIMIMQAGEEGSDSAKKWVEQPWPWEGGNC